MRFFADAVAKQARAAPPALTIGALPLGITMGTAFDARTIASKAFHVASSGQGTITMSPGVHEGSALGSMRLTISNLPPPIRLNWMSRDATSRPKVVPSLALLLTAEFTGLRKNGTTAKPPARYGAVEGAFCAR